MRFNEDWRYQFILLTISAFLISSRWPELQKAENIPLGGRHKQVSLYLNIIGIYLHHNKEKMAWPNTCPVTECITSKLWIIFPILYRL